MASVKNNNRAITVWAMISLVFIFISTPVDADVTTPLQIPISGKGSITVCVGELCGGIGEYISLIYKWLVGFAVVLAVLALTWGGVQWLISGGESGKIQEARKVIGNAVIGLLLALGSYGVLTTINTGLVTFAPLRITPISPIQLELEEIRTMVFSSGGGLHRVSSMTSNPTSWDSLLASKAAAAGVDCTLVKAIMIQESSGNPGDISPAGAVGLMQVMPREAGPDFAGRPSKSVLLDPATNVEWGIKILKGNVRETCNGKRSGDGCDVTPLGGSIASIDPARIQSDAAYARALEFLAAAYNAGPGHNRYSAEPSCRTVMRWECPKNERLYKETLPYTKRIIENFLELKSKGWGCGGTTSVTSTGSSPITIASADIEEGASPPFSTEESGAVSGSDVSVCGEEVADESTKNRSFLRLFTPAYAKPRPQAYTCPIPRIKLFNQRNYKHVTYGGCGTIDEAGCAPTSTAMVLNHYGKTVTPESVAKEFADNGFRGCKPPKCRDCNGTNWGALVSKKNNWRS